MLARLIPSGASVLDIGCGNGSISHGVMLQRPGICITGLEVLSRPDCLIECAVFDGADTGKDDESFDVCMFVDVLHHTPDAKSLLAEACRVSRRFVLIKDHISEGIMDSLILRFMDWIGNRPHGVALVYKYLSREEWKACFSSLGLSAVDWTDDVPLYAPPFHWIFGRRLHFIALLEKKKPAVGERKGRR